MPAPYYRLQIGRPLTAQEHDENLTWLEAAVDASTQNTSDIAALLASVGILDGRLSTTEGDISTLEGDVNAIQGQGLDGRVTALEADVPQNTADVLDLQNRISDLETILQNITSPAAGTWRQEEVGVDNPAGPFTGEIVADKILTINVPGDGDYYWPAQRSNSGPWFTAGP